MRIYSNSKLGHKRASGIDRETARIIFIRIERLIKSIVLRYDYSEIKFRQERDALLVEMCAGKRVLHVGACDSPYTKKKLDNGLLLHKRLQESCSSLVGVDIDETAAQYMRSKGLGDILICDITELSLTDIRPDIVILGETIEHLADPGTFVKALVQKMGPDAELVLTTPNCFGLAFQWGVVRKRETIHPDHVVGFSVGLLSQLAESVGLEVAETYFTFLPRAQLKWSRRLWRLLARCRPGWSETIVMVLKKPVITQKTTQGM